MKVTITIPQELNDRIREHIKKRFGNGKPRALSLVIREAVQRYLEAFGKEDSSKGGKE